MKKSVHIKSNWDGCTKLLVPKLPAQVITCQLELRNLCLPVKSLLQICFAISNSWIFFADGFICGWLFAVIGSREISHYFSSWGGTILYVYTHTQNICTSISSSGVFSLIINLRQYIQVDMTALVHMTDDDLKALGIPMVNSSWSLGQNMLKWWLIFFYWKSL